MELAQQAMEGYRSAFLRADLNELMDCFAFPLQVVSATGGQVSVTIADRQDWLEVLTGLLRLYRQLEVAGADMLAVEICQPLDGVAHVRVHWQLERADGSRVYDFTAAYTLASVDGNLKIIAVAQDELSKIRAAGIDVRTSRR